MNYYLVNQFNHGAEHKWVFNEDQLAEQVYHGGPVPDEDEQPYWPISGSNCGYADIYKAKNDDEIRDFLLSPGDGTEYEDPMLVDIAEYYCSVDVNDSWCYESCTGETVQRLGIQCEDTYDSCYEEAEKMISALQKAGYADFDYNDPFYGENRGMRYSELCGLYEEVCGNNQR